jgi:hypothetical protein
MEQSPRHSRLDYSQTMNEKSHRVSRRRYGSGRLLSVSRITSMSMRNCDDIKSARPVATVPVIRHERPHQLTDDPAVLGKTAAPELVSARSSPAPRFGSLITRDPFSMRRGRGATLWPDA